MAKDDVAERVRGLVETLPRADRLIVLLYFADELSPQEIAAVLELSEGHVARVIETFRQHAALRMTKPRRAA
ncbi:MAG: sigma factor-like helix-turn-helix DNA-binding protein [Planctomycetota bacterium]